MPLEPCRMGNQALRVGAQAWRASGRERPVVHWVTVCPRCGVTVSVTPGGRYATHRRYVQGMAEETGGAM